MNFIKAFNKIAGEDGSESESVAKVKKLGIDFMPDVDDQTSKVGDRVYYHGETGWKEGEDAAHTKGCDISKKTRDAVDQFTKETARKLGLDVIKDTYKDEVQNIVLKKFPHEHHRKDWKTEAVRNGDKGTIVNIKRNKSRGDDYDIRWDRHPHCVWSNYNAKDLKQAYKGFQIKIRVYESELDRMPNLAEMIKKIAAANDAKVVFKIEKSDFIRTAKNLTVSTFDLDTIKEVDALRYDWVEKLQQSNLVNNTNPQPLQSLSPDQ